MLHLLGIITAYTCLGLTIHAHPVQLHQLRVGHGKDNDPSFLLQDHSLVGKEVENSLGNVETANRITDDRAEIDSSEYQKKKYNMIAYSDKKVVDPRNLLAPEIPDILSRFYIIKPPHSYMIGDNSPSLSNLVSRGVYSISPNKNAKRKSNNITPDKLDEESSDTISWPELKRILSRFYIIRTPHGFILGDKGSTITNQAGMKRSGATPNVNENSYFDNLPSNHDKNKGEDEEQLVPSIRRITSRFYLIQTPYGYMLGDHEQSSPIRLL